MFLDHIKPFGTASVSADEVTSSVELKASEKAAKKFKPRSLGLGFSNGIASLLGVSQRKLNFEEAPYDFERILQAVDTDSYVKQAFLKYNDLFWKSGWDIVSENAQAVQYLRQRLDYMEVAMKMPFQQFLNGVVDNLHKFANAYIVKAYSTENKNGRVIGYYSLPPWCIRIQRDKHNKPLRYIQVPDDKSFQWGASDGYPTWDADEVIHLHHDRKDMHLYGTPFITAALDDVVALRTVEQDIQNLIHQDLYPFYLYKIGNEDHQAEPGEIEEAAANLANMRVEGGLIVPDRHDVEVLGAESKALNADPYLSHFKERAAVGLGVYPHHLGMSTGTTNRSTTDRLDTALYDRIKARQKEFAEDVRFHIFNEILIEGGFDPIETPSEESISDRCVMKFREIDIDTQIKFENHVANKFNNNLIDLIEARYELGMNKPIDPRMMFMMLQAQVQVNSQVEVAKVSAALQPQPISSTTGKPTGKIPPPKTADGVTSSTGVLPNMPNPKKDTGNKVAPANQFGKALSPGIRHSDDIMRINENLLDELVGLIDGEEE